MTALLVERESARVKNRGHWSLAGAITAAACVVICSGIISPLIPLAGVMGAAVLFVIWGWRRDARILALVLQVVICLPVFLYGGALIVSGVATHWRGEHWTSMDRLSGRGPIALAYPEAIRLGVFACLFAVGLAFVLSRAACRRTAMIAARLAAPPMTRGSGASGSQTLP